MIGGMLFCMCVVTFVKVMQTPRGERGDALILLGCIMLWAGMIEEFLPCPGV